MQHIPLCTSAAHVDEADTASCGIERDVVKSESEDDVLSAWVTKNVSWKEKDELTVRFLNTIPPEWTYRGSGINVGNIMIWANEWNLRGGGTIPTFTLVRDVDGPSDIRVLFTSKIHELIAANALLVLADGNSFV